MPSTDNLLELVHMVERTPSNHIDVVLTSMLVEGDEEYLLHGTFFRRLTIKRTLRCDDAVDLCQRQPRRPQPLSCGRPQGLYRRVFLLQELVHVV